MHKLSNTIEAIMYNSYDAGWNEPFGYGKRFHYMQYVCWSHKHTASISCCIANIWTGVNSLACGCADNIARVAL